MRKITTNRGEIMKFDSIESFSYEVENFEEPKQCEHCGETLKPIGFDGLVLFNATSLMDKNQKQQMFRKRSRDHYKTNGEMKDRVRDLQERTNK